MPDLLFHPISRMALLFATMRRSALHLGILWGFGLVSFSAGAAQLGAGLTVNPVPAGESTVYQLQVVNGKADALPEFPSIQGLQSEYMGQSSSSKTQIINGRMQQYRTLIYQWRLVAQSEGVFLIPPIEVVVGGKTLQTPSVQLRVSKGINYDEYAFIQLNLPRKSFYEGEPFTFSVDLLELNATVNQAPDIEVDGLVIQRISDNLRSTRKVVGNRTYNVNSLDYVGRSVRNGSLTLGPFSWPVSLVFRQNGRSRSFFDSFFDQGTRREVVLSAPAESLNIMPLPTEGRPTDFGGAIGNYQMQVEASPMNLKVGDPLTVKVRIFGEGSLEAIQMPSIDHWTDFKTYPPNARTEASDPSGLKGSRFFEQVVIPQNSEMDVLPPLVFSYFNPMEGTYHTIEHPAMALKVSPNPQAPSVSSAPVEGITEAGLPKPRPKDIVPIKPFLGSSVALSQPWAFSTVFYWFQSIPVVLLGMLALVAKWRDSQTKNPIKQRKRQVDQWLKAQYPQLESLAQKGDGNSFFEYLFRMIQERLGQVLDMPAASITEDVVDHPRLVEQLTGPHHELLRELFDACNHARYAPESDHRKLVEFSSKARELLEGFH